MPGQNTLLVFLISLVGAFSAGWIVHGWKYGADDKAAIQASQRLTEKGQSRADDAGLSASSTQADLKRKAEENEKAFKQASKDLVDCRVSSDILSVLNDAELSKTTRAAKRTAAEAARTQATWSSCITELNTARDNYATVCVPNQEQLRDVQRFYDVLKNDYNSGRAR